MFRAGRTYRNEAGRDLDIFIVKVHYKDAKRIKLKVHFIYRSNGQIQSSENIELKSEHEQYWREIKLVS